MTPKSKVFCTVLMGNFLKTALLVLLISAAITHVIVTHPLLFLLGIILIPFGILCSAIYEGYMRETGNVPRKRK